jgi:hypothetical protein
MANTYTLISSTVLDSTTATVTLTSIPQTYTDLVLQISARCNRATFTCQLLVKPNGLTTNLSTLYLDGDGSATSSSNETTLYISQVPGTDQTANTFNSAELYIPNYTDSTYTQPFGSSGVSEQNSASTQVFIRTGSSYWSATTAITSLDLYLNPTQSFLSGSSFYLYGIKNS